MFLLRKSVVTFALTLGLMSPLVASGQTHSGWGGQQNPQGFQQRPAVQGVVVNGVPLSPQQVAQNGQMKPGRYWYDAQTGAWGTEGSGVLGFIQAGLQAGPLQSNASNGRTGVFINGRQLPQSDLTQFQQAVGQQVPAGRYWCRASGDCGQEGNPQVLVNVRNSGNDPSMLNVPGPGHGTVGGGISGACFEGAGGKMVCWDEGIGSSSY